MSDSFEALLDMFLLAYFVA